MGGATSIAAPKPTPAAPPPPPQVQQPAESTAASQAEAQAANRAGVGATIKTSAQGVQHQATIGTTSLIGD
ncbi:hypothetical protein [Paraburkholderia tuberum]|uniref:Uncharacterized protein n=1 Tax=Paraburkholderia tuberum TaxID=157910 RepID=A0A1H0ZPX0_9BURK|nr:hypothetical protein [Paraburkholderia tuberum]SDQ29424.1 hypothetical protein SAMN05445850_0152 [Paraburkholderia tuberum]